MYYVDLALSGLTFGCMYAVMAVGLTLIYGLLRILHIAHAAVFALGAYAMVVVANLSGSLLVGFLGAIIVAPIVGMAIYRLLYEPLLKYRPDVPMIASLGLLVFMQDGFRIVFGEQGVTLHRDNYDLLTATKSLGVTVNGVQIAIFVVGGVVFLGAASIHDADADRDRHGARQCRDPKHRCKLRRRPDPGTLSQFRHRLGAGGDGWRRSSRLLNNFVDPAMGYRRQLQGAGDHRARRARQRARAR